MFPAAGSHARPLGQEVVIPGWSLHPTKPQDQFRLTLRSPRDPGPQPPHRRVGPKMAEPEAGRQRHTGVGEPLGVLMRPEPAPHNLQGAQRVAQALGCQGSSPGRVSCQLCGLSQETRTLSFPGWRRKTVLPWPPGLAHPFISSCLLHTYCAPLRSTEKSPPPTENPLQHGVPRRLTMTNKDSIRNLHPQPQ